MKIISSKEKIDKILGIPTNTSVDDFLNSIVLSSDTTMLSSMVDSMKECVIQNAENIDNISTSEQPLLQMNSLVTSLHEIEDIVVLAKNMFRHVYEQIISVSLLDSEAISAAAKLLESIHVNIAEFVSIYQSKVKFYELMQKMNLQHQFELVKMEKRFEYDMKKMKAKVDAGATPAEEGKYPVSFEKMIEMLAEAEEKNSELEAELDDANSKVNSSNNDIEIEEK